VRGAFVENFQRHGEVGAAVSVMVDGQSICGRDMPIRIRRARGA